MKKRFCAGLAAAMMLFGITAATHAAEQYRRAVVIVSGGAAVSPFTTPTSACKKGWAAGSTDTFLRNYLLKKGHKVFTSPAYSGYGEVPKQGKDDIGPYDDCPAALSDFMTVNSTGDIQLAGVRLANFVNYLQREYGVKEIDFVAHSMGGLYSRSAIKSLQMMQSPIKVRSLTTLATPWDGVPFANFTCAEIKDDFCESIAKSFLENAPVIPVELKRENIEALNKYNANVLNNIPVTLIGADAFKKENGDSAIWPNDGIVNLSSMLAQDASNSGIKHRRCHIFKDGTHSIWISEHKKWSNDTAITWNDKVAAWVDQAIRDAGTAHIQENRQGCP